MDTSIVRRTRLLLECIYVSIPVTLAVLGNERGYAGWYFAALAVTLPCGIIGFVGIYGGFALIRGVGDLITSSTTSNGTDASWFDSAIDVLRVSMFAGAAILNLVLLKRLLRYGSQRLNRRRSTTAG